MLGKLWWRLWCVILNLVAPDSIKSSESNQAIDIQTNIKNATNACNNGNANVCSILCLLYYYGDESKEIKQDYIKAFNFALKACNLKDMWACNSVGLMYKMAMV